MRQARSDNTPHTPSPAPRTPSPPLGGEGRGEGAPSQFESDLGIRTAEPAVRRRGVACKLASVFPQSHALAANMARSENESAQLAARVEQIVASTPILDVHTHLYDPAFGNLLLWGIDDLLVYHYLVAEAFRHFDLPYEKFRSLSKAEQAGRIWQALFIEHSPVSEACRGVLTTLNAFGLDVKKRDLPALRKWFAGWKVADYLDRCLELAGVNTVHMTNSPFDDAERLVWEQGFRRDERFVAALRIDPLLDAWRETAPILSRWGFKVGASLTEKTISEVRRFLAEWTNKIQARYLMVSLPPTFNFPAAGPCARLLEKAVLPHCREFGLPLALMLGVKRRVNPELQMAGDGVGGRNLPPLHEPCHP